MEMLFCDWLDPTYAAIWHRRSIRRYSWKLNYWNARSATLSTLSSCLNSLATVIFVEMESRKSTLNPSIPRLGNQLLLQALLNISVTILALILPMYVIILGFKVLSKYFFFRIPETISGITNAVLGSLTAPSFGLFILAFFFRENVNSKVQENILKTILSCLLWVVILINRFQGAIAGFIVPVFPIILFFIGQNRNVRTLVPPEFKMMTNRNTSACPENAHTPQNTSFLPSTSYIYPVTVRFLTLSPHFIGILSLILFFLVVLSVSKVTTRENENGALKPHRELTIKLVDK